VFVPDVVFELVFVWHAVGVELGVLVQTGLDVVVAGKSDAAFRIGLRFREDAVERRLELDVALGRFHVPDLVRVVPVPEQLFDEQEFPDVVAGKMEDCVVGVGRDRAFAFEGDARKVDECVRSE
jgi:hypothetical protein